MTTFTPSRHAEARMQQRGIPAQDVDLIVLIGTEVDDGYLVRTYVQAVERDLKYLLARIRRLEGKRLVTAERRIGY
jgi:hypothetical protein